MKRLNISAVRDLTFGRHSGRTFDGLDSDFVVVHGPNESGKSTLAEFLTWAIGGPWRMYGNNADAFRGVGDGKMVGRLLGTLGTEPIDIQAKFELRMNNPARDKRSGLVGATEVDGEAFQRFLGGIDPNDYEMMYRCYGATLGDIGSGGSFENLFARFAMGGTSGVRNPREALKGLREASSKAERLVKSLTTEINAIEKEIKEARTNPDVVARLVAERDQINGRITELDTELAVNASRESLLVRVLKGHDHHVQLDRAQAALADTPAISASWSIVVDNVAEITDLAGRITSAAHEVEQSRTLFGSAAAVAGMDMALLEGRTLRAPERLQITDAASALLRAREDAGNARARLSDIEGQRTAAEMSAGNLARTAGLDDADLARLDTIETQLPDLVNRAVRWSEDTNKAIDAEAQVVGETERRKSANGAPTPSATTTGPDPKLVALAVLMVAGASVIHWGAALVVALGAAAYFVFGRAGTSAATSDRAPVADNTTLANLQGRATEHRESAQNHRRLLDDGLGVLARYVTSVDLAQKQLQQLIELAARRRTLRELDDQAATLARRVADLEPDVAEAEAVVRGLLEPRGISVGLVNTAFEKWLTKYEAAVMASASLTTANDALTSLRDRMSELTAPVASETDGLTPAAIVARVNEKKEAASRRRAVESAVREAEALFRGADLDSPEVREIMSTYQDSTELRAQLEITQSRAQATRVERDASNTRLGEIRVEIDGLEGTEVLPGLLLQKGNLEDAKEEAKARHETLATAHELLGAAIDEHERDNQDPVVARASDLVAEVVPGWGTVIKRRDEAGKLLIERVGSDGRVGDHAISDGGRALLYLAIRLAFAQQDASRRQISLPIICDDPLIHFDDVRQQAAVQLLKSVSAEHQVVLFTCERDTRDFAASLGASVVEM